MNTLVEPTTARGQRVLAIMQAAHAGENLRLFRRSRPDLWPRGDAGDRKWTRDLRDVLHGRVYGHRDMLEDRRVKVLEWLAEHDGATTHEVAEALGIDRDTVYVDLRLAGAVVCAYRWVRVGRVRARRARWTIPEVRRAA